jgi:DNA replication protein DnaC
MPCKCQAERKRERLFKNSKITPAFKAKSFYNFKPKGRPGVVAEMLMSAQHYANNFSELGEQNWLVLLGEPGCGKTHLSMAVANQLINQGVPVLYFPHVEGFSEIQSTFRNSEDDAESRLREMRKVPLLVWDDLFKGLERPRGWMVRMVFDVLNYRYLNLLPTIISSELVPAQLMAVDGSGALGSRILERGKEHTVVASGIECNYRLGGI